MWFFKKKIEKPEPRKNVSVRMEAIGGQGANSAGKILAEAAVLGMGYTGNHFSSFGSEKRGSPVRSFVRYATNKKNIRTASFIKNPDLLVIFHESLMLSHQEILDGVDERTDIIINTSLRPRDIKFPQGIRFRTIITIDATLLANKSKCGINAVMLGAVAHFCHEIDQDKIRSTLSDYFLHLSAEVIQNNLNGFDQAQKNFSEKILRDEQASEEIQKSILPEIGWVNAPIGGVILSPGATILKDHSSSRKGTAPRFTKEICFNCGYCDMVCPDFCFVWKLDSENQKKPELMGIDYQYCKGCQKCVQVCPVQALTPVDEYLLTDAEKSLKLFPEIQTRKSE